MSLKSVLATLPIESILSYVNEPMTMLHRDSFEKCVFPVVPEKVYPVLENLREDDDYKDSFSKEGHRYNSHLGVANFFFMLEDAIHKSIVVKLLDNNIPMEEMMVKLSDFINEPPLINDGSDDVYKEAQATIKAIVAWGTDETIYEIGNACDGFTLKEIKHLVNTHGEEVIWIKELIVYIANVNKASKDDDRTKGMLSFARAFLCTTLACLAMEERIKNENPTD